uniref:Helitron helicase-like domain-containing protein n=1 Tax=Anopheles atroparvus TaxID=41427 RepID=A0A182JMJ7_ANOAO
MDRCNPHRPEITQELLPRQYAEPDLMSVGSQNCVIEYQKRDLPHAHCLMVFADAEKPRSAADYEFGWLVLAKIPDRANEQLYETISETQYLDAQYISTSQAISTFFGYKMQAKR